MASELGVNNSKKLASFKELYDKYTFTLKVKNNKGEFSKGFLSMCSIRGGQTWLTSKNCLYLFLPSDVISQWCRFQEFMNSEEELFLKDLNMFLRRQSQDAYEMASDRYMFQFGGPTRIMGILNATPDSFSDAGAFAESATAIERALEMEDYGADIIDIGGESTRPGAIPVPEATELSRVIPIIERLAPDIKIPISIDTYKSEVAEAAIQAGATIINDISGLRFDTSMLDVVLHYETPIVLMHMKGQPRDMQVQPAYDHLMDEIYGFFEQRIADLEEAGLERSRIVIDPGLGFGKKLWDNYEIVQRLPELKGLGCPLMIGPSRKSFIGKILDLPVGERLEGTSAFVIASILNGCQLVRVHDVKEILRAVQIADLLSGNVTLENPGA